MKAKVYLITLLIILLTACQGSKDHSSDTVSPLHPITSLHLSVGSEPITLDIHRSSDPSSIGVLKFTCETLLATPSEPNEPIQLWLAESWSINTTNTVITISLRSGIMFHNQRPVTAESVKSSFTRLQDPDSHPSPVHENFEGVNIITSGDHTIIFHLPNPNPDFLGLLTSPYTAIIDTESAYSDPSDFSRNPVCTGPYYVKEWHDSDSIILERSSTYKWPPSYYTNRGPSYIDQIVIRFVSENDIRYRLLVEGELDTMALTTSEQILDIQAKPDQYQLYETLIGGVTFVGFNYAFTPTNNLLLRQALAHAIDKDGIVNATLKGLADPAMAPLSPGIFGYDSSLRQANYLYDPARSRTLLAEAGFKDSDGDGIVERNGKALTLRILTTTSSTYSKIVVFLQDQFKQVGIATSVQAVDRSKISEITPTGAFDVLVYEYSWNSPDALQLFLGTERIGASNRVAYSNPIVDALLKQALSIPGASSEKRDLLIQAQRLILQDAPWQPLFVRKYVVAVNKRVQGVKFTSNGELLWHDASIIGNR